MKTLIILLLTTVCAVAQEDVPLPPQPSQQPLFLPGVLGIPRGPRVPLRTHYNITGPKGTMLVVELKRDGEIKIDWDAVERNAAEDMVTPENNTIAAAAIARLMLAIRDRTWKTME